jgi:hypothetical protein
VFTTKIPEREFGAKRRAFAVGGYRTTGMMSKKIMAERGGFEQSEANSQPVVFSSDHSGV